MLLDRAWNGLRWFAYILIALILIGAMFTGFVVLIDQLIGYLAGVLS